MRKRYVFRGTVQHVGFRYRAVTSASKLGLTGWVYNFPDGTVMMEAQGEEWKLDALAGQLCETKYGRVSVTDIVTDERDDEEGFRVVYGV